MWLNLTAVVERSSWCTVALDVSRSVRFGGERREEGRFSGTIIASRCYLGLDRGTITRASAWLPIVLFHNAWRAGTCLCCGMVP